MKIGSPLNSPLSKGEQGGISSVLQPFGRPGNPPQFLFEKGGTLNTSSKGNVQSSHLVQMSSFL